MSGSTKRWLAVAAMGILAGTAVMAEEAAGEKACPKRKGPRHGAWFKKMDADGNGTVSLAEFTAAEEKRIEARKKKMGDKWNAEKAAKMPSAEERFKKLDKDGNGELTPDEMKSGHKKHARKGNKGNKE
jgi:hypothetical protein